MDIPVEIFFMVYLQCTRILIRILTNNRQIVSNLHPLDLLHLARVSKHFRQTFMVKSARNLWAAARQNVPEDLPAPPDYLSEPQYASILFEHFCFVGQKHHQL